MKNKDAAIIKALVQAGVRKEPELSLDQEDMLKRALDPNEEYLYRIEQVFKTLDKEKTS